MWSHCFNWKIIDFVPYFKLYVQYKLPASLLYNQCLLPRLKEWFLQLKNNQEIYRTLFIRNRCILNAKNHESIGKSRSGKPTFPIYKTLYFLFRTFGICTALSFSANAAHGRRTVQSICWRYFSSGFIIYHRNGIGLTILRF